MVEGWDFQGREAFGEDFWSSVKCSDSYTALLLREKMVLSEALLCSASTADTGKRW
jgi:hypothetical protein